MAKGKFAADRPIETSEEDRLGFNEPAELIAKAILDFASPEGFVIGLEGEWGTGKSSLINLISKHLKFNEKSPEIIHFSPWLISSRNGLLSELFKEIGIAADKIQNHTDEITGSKWWQPKKSNQKERNSLKANLNKYSNHLIMAGEAARFAGVVLPGFGLAEVPLKHAGQTAKKLSEESPLDIQKEHITEELSKLKRQIVIFIDDLDRLEPHEVGEVVRLVRAVADFPNIIYVLSYSRQILEASLAKAYKLDEGHHYIDKIVQVTFSVPRPENFTLRKMFRMGLAQIFPLLNDTVPTHDHNSSAQRIAEAIDKQGARTLQCPRDVAKSLNSMRLYAGPIQSSIDLSDMTWLQLIRVRNNDLYKWIENYMNNVGAMLNEGGQVSSGLIEKDTQALIDIIKKEESSNNIDYTLYDFATIIPGISKKNFSQENELAWTVYDDITTENTADFVKNKRLGSPNHYRYYFALSKPTAALSDEEFANYLKLLENNYEEALKHFLSLCDKRIKSNSVAVNHLINRFQAIDINQLTQNQIKNMLLNLAEGMDITALMTGRESWGRYWVWDPANALFKKLFSALDGDNKKPVIQKVFGKGDAIGWLSEFVRAESFAHGICGDQLKPKELWLFSKDEVILAINEFVKNLKSCAPKKVMQSPNLANILFAWLQGRKNGKQEIRKHFDEYFRTDEGLLLFLSGMRGWRSTNGEISYPLKENMIDEFIDVKKARRKIEAISENVKHPLYYLAQEIIKALELGSDQRF